MLQQHRGRAAHGLAEGKPRQYPREIVERESGPARISRKARIQHYAEYEEISEHQQQRAQDRPERSAKGAAIAAQDVAPNHNPDQSAIAPDGAQRIDESPAGGAKRTFA